MENKEMLRALRKELVAETEIFCNIEKLYKEQKRIRYEVLERIVALEKAEIEAVRVQQKLFQEQYMTLLSECIYAILVNVEHILRLMSEGMEVGDFGEMNNE